MNKPVKPNIVIPESFAENGIKTDFDNEKLTNGFDRLQPDVLAGDNLNKFIDDTYKGLNYGMAAADAINLINEGETLTVVDGKLTSGATGGGLELCDTDIVIRDDEKMFTQLQQMRRSTFDLSKFTVVGSPTITDDGIASEFSSNKYIKCPFDVGSNIWELKFVINPSSKVSVVTGLLGRNGVASFAANIVSDTSGTFVTPYFSSNGTDFDIGNFQSSSLTLNTDNLIKIGWDGTKYYITVNGGTPVTLDSTTPIYNSNEVINICTNRNASSFYNKGSIDLKNFSITVDGVEVFSGNKTGLDVIKADNYEVVGSPVISDDGVASGFSASDYLMANTFTIDATKPWYLQCKFTTDTLGTSQGLVTFSEYFYLVLSSNKNLSFRTTNANQHNWINTVALREKTEYTVDCGYDGTYLYLNLYLPNGQILNYNRNVTSTYIGTTLQPASIGKHGNFIFTGSIDLNAFKIYVDGNLVYQPCLKIPYTQSKTGSKIVDVAYRDRVIDLYEQEGQAGYYTIDEPNKNFTLPMGEIYGMIESKGTYQPPLLSTMWSDHLLNYMSWLRADTFSWQDGNAYSLAYNELLSEYNNSASTTETEGSITFKRTPKGYKIALATQETAILNKYNSDGIAWYYILDTANKRFKLPRTKFGFEGIRTSVGDDIVAGAPNITGNITNVIYGGTNETSAENANPQGSLVYRGDLRIGSYHAANGAGSNLGNYGLELDASLSNPIYGNSDTVQPPATQMYLYFYVGEFTQTAIEQTAGLNAELFNGKADVDTPSIQAPYLKTTYVNGTSGYRIWSDGYCEQWGQGKVISSGYYMRVKFIKPFANTNYIGYGIALSSVENIDVLNYVGIQAKTVNGCTFIGSTHAAAQSNMTMLWKVEGYIA